MRILFLEDDPMIAKTVASDLREAGYTVIHSGTIADARKAFRDGDFALLLLDVNLPDGNSLDFCREALQERPGTPALILTAKTDEQTAVRSLSIGAVDFIRKPFSRSELMLRIRNNLRGRKGMLEFHGLLVNLDTQKVTFGGKELTVTRKELEVLAALLRRPGDAVNREAILQAVDPEAKMSEGTLNTHISRLRSKIAQASGDVVRIEPVYGVGYRIHGPAKKKSA